MLSPDPPIESHHVGTAAASDPTELYTGPNTGFVQQFDLGTTRWLDVQVGADREPHRVDNPDTVALLLDYFSRPQIVFPVEDEALVPGAINMVFAYPNRFGWAHFQVRFDLERALVCRDGFGVCLPDLILRRLLSAGTPANPEQK
jgi:hypothetical protein